MGIGMTPVYSSLHNRQKGTRFLLGDFLKTDEIRHSRESGNLKVFEHVTFLDPRLRDGDDR